MNLRDYLHFNRICVTEFSKKTGISRSYLNIIINRNYRPSIRIAKCIEEATDKQVTALELIL
jgi:DNA-binding transcriptional regulator YdaS (Cro superfamily)